MTALVISVVVAVVWAVAVARDRRGCEYPVGGRKPVMRSVRYTTHTKEKSVVIRRVIHILIATLLLLAACFAGARLAAEADTIPLGNRCWDTNTNKLGHLLPDGRCDTRRPWTECWEAHLAYLTGTFLAEQYPAHLVNGRVCHKPWWVR